MPSEKELVKKTAQQKKAYIEDSSDDESDDDIAQPKRGCLERCTLSPVEAEPPNKSSFTTNDRLLFLSEKISLLTSSPQKLSISEVSCKTPLIRIPNH